MRWTRAVLLMFATALVTTSAAADEPTSRRSEKRGPSFVAEAAERYDALLQQVRELRRMLSGYRGDDVQARELDDLEAELKDLGGLVRWLQETPDPTWTGVHDEVDLRLWELGTRAENLQARLSR